MDSIDQSPEELDRVLYVREVKGPKTLRAHPRVSNSKYTLTRAEAQLVEENKMNEDEFIDDEMDDLGLDMDLPDIPLPDEVEEESIVEDKFESAVQFSFLGVGHGGSRIAESFYELGYRRVCVVNTAKQDLDDIDIPEKRKLWLGAGGAAKNRRIGDHYLREHYEDTVELMRRAYGTKFDRIMVCATAGGGTGSGGFEAAIEIANDLVESLRIKKVGDDTKVGLIIAIPSNSERDRMGNAYDALKATERLLKQKDISPVVIVDNEQIGRMFRASTMGNVWGRSNKSVTSMFHLFNKTAHTQSRYTQFDPADYNSVLDSGIVTYGAMPIKSTQKDDMAQAVRENISKTVLSSNGDLKSATMAACLLLGQPKVIDDIPTENVDNAYEMLNRVIGGGIVHRGIYPHKSNLSAYTLVGGLPMPKARLDEVAKMAGHVDWDD